MKNDAVDRFRLEQRIESLEREIKDIHNFLAKNEGDLPDGVDEQLKRSGRVLSHVFLLIDTRCPGIVEIR